jgi:hypothetical protein
MTNPYIPARILRGDRPSARGCFGCSDVESRRYSDRTVRICGVSGTTFRQTLECPKRQTSHNDASRIGANHSGGNIQ